VTESDILIWRFGRFATKPWMLDVTVLCCLFIARLHTKRKTIYWPASSIVTKSLKLA